MINDVLFEKTLISTNSLLILLDSILNKHVLLADLRDTVKLADKLGWQVMYLTASDTEEIISRLHSMDICINENLLYKISSDDEIPALLQQEPDKGHMRILISASPVPALKKNKVTANELYIEITEQPLSTGEAIVGIRRLIDIVPLLELKDGNGLKNLLMTDSYSSLLEKLYSRYASIYDQLKDRQEVYIFGAFRNGIKTLEYCRQKNIKVIGFIDNDPAKQGTILEDKKIFSLDEIEDREAVILNSSGRYAVPINDQLRQAGFKHRLSFSAFLFFTDVPYQAEEKFRNYILDLFINKHRYISLYLLLGDSKSRIVLDNLINLRLTMDQHYAERTSGKTNDVYFDEDLIDIGQDEVFIDGGAYDGDTSKLFITRCAGDYRHIYLFEPDPSIYEKTVLNMKDLKNVTVFAKGLYSFDGSLSFSATGEMNSAISESGSNKLEVVSLDNSVPQPVTFIKLDVEGAEAETIKGAEAHIRQTMPKLALGAYHRCHDLWDLARIISSIEPRYQFFLRHYSHIIDDTTLYAVLRK